MPNSWTPIFLGLDTIFNLSYVIIVLNSLNSQRFQNFVLFHPKNFWNI